jgi:hypothetical protein
MPRLLSGKRSSKLSTDCGLNIHNTCLSLKQTLQVSSPAHLVYALRSQSLLTQHPAATTLLSISEVLPILEISYKWNFMIGSIYFVSCLFHLMFF